LKKIQICNVSCHLIICLRHIHNSFEAVSIKIKPIFNYLTRYLIHIILHISINFAPPSIRSWFFHLVSIWSMLFACIFRTKVLLYLCQSQNKLEKRLSYEKRVGKMLMKLTPEVGQMQTSIVKYSSILHWKQMQTNWKILFRWITRTEILYSGVLTIDLSVTQL